MRKISRYNKTNLSKTYALDLSVNGSMSLVINHKEGVVKKDSCLIPYSIEGVSNHLSEIKKIDFYSVFRKKISMNSVGVNEKTISDIGKDKGAYLKPEFPADLPPGIKELYRLQ